MTTRHGAQIELRWYQDECKKAIYRHLESRDDNPCAVLPTGAGKTPVVASICHDAVETWGGRVLVLAHVKELLEQHRDALSWIDPWLQVGVYSAGLNRRQTQEPVILAGIQSVYDKADKLGWFDLVIIDEAHLIPPDGEGMYQTLLNDLKVINPHIRLIGLTATAFRTKDGWICAPNNLLNRVCYEVGVRELVNQGFLTKLRSKGTRTEIDYKAVHIRGGEFVADELESAMLGVVDKACEELLAHTNDRHSVLVFASGISHAAEIEARLRRAGHVVAMVTGDTPKDERAATVHHFRSGDIRYLVNVGVYTTGFDATNVDCVAILRATLSPGLYYQMVGRGFRTHASKSDCLVLDFGGNIDRHGPVDALKIMKRSGPRVNGDAPTKQCPECSEIVHAGYLKCPECGYDWPIPQRKSHDEKASDSSPLSGSPTRHECPVDEILYDLHLSKKSNILTMRVDYHCGVVVHSEWVCFDHEGYAREKACYWWRKRSTQPIPQTTQEAVRRAQEGELLPASKITVESKTGEKFSRIVEYLFREPGDEFGEEMPGKEADDDWLTVAVAQREESWLKEDGSDIPF